MPGLGAIRGVFGGVLLFSVLALVFLIIGLVVPDWMNYDYGVEEKKRNYKMGLFVFTPVELIGAGKCNYEGCEDEIKDDQEKAFEENCKAYMKKETGNDDHSECSYYGDGYCRCPYPEDNHTVEKKYTQSNGEPVQGFCKSEKYDDTTHENMKEYAESMKSTHTIAVVMLIIAIVLVGLAIILAVVDFIIVKWILGIVGAIFLFLALIFAIVGIIMGTSFTNKSLKQRHCGSDKAWDEYLAGPQSQISVGGVTINAKISDVNSFGVGPIFVLIGIIFLFIAVILDCLASGLAKKLEKVVNIDVDGDGRIG